MSKRILWVVEIRSVSGEWHPIYNYDTREEAREQSRCLDCCKNIRVVKYVPAETSKKAGVK